MNDVEDEQEQEVGRWVVRSYGEKVGDYQMVAGWMEGRGMGRLLENLLPPMGIVVECDGEAVAASWIYLCYGIGVGFWEGLITKPGLSPAMGLAACRHCLGALKAIAVANDVSVIKAYAKGTLARQAEKHGFVKLDEGLSSLITIA
ncbi:hypothetical protein [Roseimicrobium sp. ORNL1]|uniref:hypothetical protein n=1 Tax=Roseimicrobium sp. ORNL1 TaxID=2711231 RepID=UPI0013E20349|nr:hypothetical protein [Roseimicrobium sp. ORNL1]QIF01924.1 hypothetical protein G5S37_10415 [Roseimicrobium sp. ORNL1]